MRELFFSHGFAEVSVNDICARAGMTKGAFYYHFDSKEDLFRLLFNCFSDEFDLESDSSEEYDEDDEYWDEDDESYYEDDEYWDEADDDSWDEAEEDYVEYDEEG